MAPSFDCVANAYIESCEDQEKLRQNAQILAQSGENDVDEPVSMLVQRETHYMLPEDYLQRLRNRTLDVNVRREAVGWILKVHSFYNFGAPTAYLAVNYLDRFLSRHRMPQGVKAWMIQLMAVACLSLAAKMEETQVPLPSDLQREDARFIFDARTIQRMELLILSTLQWGMRSITPFSFIDYFAYSAVQGHGHGHDATPPKAVMSRAIELILSTTGEIDFMEYRPSAIAAAALLCAAEEVVPLQAVHYKRALSSSITDVDKDKMFGCYNLIQETIIEGGCYWTPMSLQSTEKTPVGVLDAAACLSNTPTSSYSVKPYASVTAAKRRKLNEICSALLVSQAHPC